MISTIWNHSDINGLTRAFMPCFNFPSIMSSESEADTPPVSKKKQIFQEEEEDDSSDDDHDGGASKDDKGNDTEGGAPSGRENDADSDEEDDEDQEDEDEDDDESDEDEEEVSYVTQNLRSVKHQVGEFCRLIQV